MKYGLLLIVAAVLLAGCAKLSSPPSGDISKSVEAPQQEFYDATITFYQADKINGVLQAGRIRKFEKSATILLDSSVIMDFYNELGQHTTKLWADSARTDENHKDMIAMGDVIAKSDSGETLLSDQLRWDNRTRQIRSDTRVKLMTPTDTINGIGFISDEHLRNWKITAPVGLTFRELQKPPSHDQISPASPGDTTRTDSARADTSSRPDSVIHKLEDTLR